MVLYARMVGMHAGSIAEDPFNCEVISHEEGAVQQLILMALSDNEVVVEQACKTIGGSRIIISTK